MEGSGDSNVLVLVELILVLTLVLGLGLRELYGLRRDRVPRPPGAESRAPPPDRRSGSARR